VRRNTEADPRGPTIMIVLALLLALDAGLHGFLIYRFGVGQSAANNLLYDGPLSAILFGGNGHRIELNEIHDVCYEVDDAVRNVLVTAGLEPYLLHRTGHSLGTAAVHGDAANFDGVETLDERLVLPRLGFTVEPGVYLPDFGVRSELNVVTTEAGLVVTTAVQEAVDVL